MISVSSSSLFLISSNSSPSILCFFFSSRRRHTSSTRDWSSDVCSSDLCSTVGRSRWNDAGMTVPLIVGQQRGLLVRRAADGPLAGGPASGRSTQPPRCPRLWRRLVSGRGPAGLQELHRGGDQVERGRARVLGLAVLEPPADDDPAVLDEVLGQTSGVLALDRDVDEVDQGRLLFALADGAADGELEDDGLGRAAATAELGRAGEPADEDGEVEVHDVAPCFDGQGVASGRVAAKKPLQSRARGWMVAPVWGASMIRSRPWESLPR